MRKTKLFSLALLTVAWFGSGSVWAQSEPEQDSDGWYLLGSVDDVEWFGQQVMDGKHATIKGKLTADIDYEGVENRHRPIGHYGQKFVGKFDGQGHRIKNMVLNDPTLPKGNDDGTGFFGCVRIGGDGFIMGSDTEKETNDLVEIKNLIIDASCTITSSRANTAGLVGRISEKTTNNTVLIENCINEATINTTAAAPAGIVGQINNAADGNVTIRNCINKGTITTSGLAAAGIISQVNNCAVKLNIESCMNLANIESTGSKNCGGIHGANTSSKGIIKIINCGNTGNVTGTDESAALTGWIGSNSGNVITNCWNTGTVKGVKGTDNTYRGTVTVTNVYDINGGQGTLITNEMVASGELCYKLNGEQSDDCSWYQTIPDDSYPVPFNSSGIVYLVSDQYCDGTPKGIAAYSNNKSGGVRDNHEFDVTTGLCKNCSYPNITWISVSEDGFLHLSTPTQIEWLSAMVEKVDGNLKVKLDDDIDFEGLTCTPIGQSTSHKFYGIFDGQHNHIKNLHMTGVNTGFFGFVGGGTTIQNLIIDGTCSFEATERCGSLIAIVHEQAGGPVSINNVVNYASVTSGTKVAAGIIAAGWTDNDHPVVNMANCVNAGAVTCTGGDKAAGLLGWNKSASISTLKACYNIGLLNPIDGENNLFRGSNRSMPNSYDLVNTTAQGKTGKQGLKTDWVTQDPLTSGELCYVLNNGDMSDNGIPYTQDLSDEKSNPLPIPGGLTVYQNADYLCPDVISGGVSFANTNSSTGNSTSHTDNTKGFCIYCNKVMPEHIVVDTDGFFPLASVDDVEWFSGMVAAGNLVINGKLMNDIDFDNVENAHNPIGPNEQNKFNGTFDGQGYRIKNMIIERPTENNVGFFGWLRGNNANTTVKNLIIDSSCSIHGYNRVGGVTGTYQNGGMTITIENVVNEAAVTAEHQDAGGIFGGHDAGNPVIIIRNVMNTGTITAKNEHPYAGALCCYMGVGDGSLIENFVNLGTVNGHEGGNIGRHNIGNVKNLIDLSDTEDKTQGVDDGLTAEDVENGKLAYTVGWGQLIDTDAIPYPLNETEVSYVGDAGYATMYDATTGYELNGDVEAYVATINPQYPNLILAKVDNVPAGTPVILKGSYYNKVAADLPAINAANALLGTAVDTEADGTMYVLAKVDDKVGFYKATGTIPAGKAYYQSGAGVKAFYFDGDAETAINEVNGQSSMVNGQSIYNLAGQRVSKMQKGINIVNGKKVLK